MIFFNDFYNQVNADYKRETYEPDAKERRKMQTETLSRVFETYFRILRNTMHSIGERYFHRLFIAVSMNLVFLLALQSEITGHVAVSMF